MPRVLDMPPDLHCITREPLTGPRSKSSASESLKGFQQTVSSPFGLWRWQFTYPELKGRAFRLYRGMVAALHGGGNAVRMPFCDPDGLSYAAAGAIATDAQIRSGVPWSNGQPWKSGRNWHASRPKEAVLGSVALGGSFIQVGTQYWGGSIGLGAFVGFEPFHYGLYTITEDFGGGAYRIWPPLRAAIDTTMLANLNPVLAMRLEGESGAPLARSATGADALSLILIEIGDADVRAFYDN